VLWRCTFNANQGCISRLNALPRGRRRDASIAERGKLKVILGDKGLSERVLNVM
jgi:hypothetical protein